MKKVWFSVLILLAIGITACGSTAPSSELSTVAPAEFTLVATDIAYDNSTLEVTAGQPVKITFRNEGFLEHDFSIMEIEHSGDVSMSHEEGEADEHGHDMTHMDVLPDVHVAAAMQGGSSTLEFTPSEPGEYEFYCTVAGHKEAGMVGKLIVNAP